MAGIAPRRSGRRAAQRVRYGPLERVRKGLLLDMLLLLLPLLGLLRLYLLPILTLVLALMADVEEAGSGGLRRRRSGRSPGRQPLGNGRSWIR